MKRRFAVLVPGIVAGAVFLAACGGGGTTTTKPSGGSPAAKPGGAAAATVNMIAGNKYDPATVTVKKGETVKFVNKDSQIHDVKFQSGPNSPSVMNPGADWSRTFDAAGTFPYICTYHEAEGMKGTVTVQ